MEERTCAFVLFRLGFRALPPPQNRAKWLLWRYNSQIYDLIRSITFLNFQLLHLAGMFLSCARRKQKNGIASHQFIWAKRGRMFLGIRNSFQSFRLCRNSIGATECTTDFARATALQMSGSSEDVARTGGNKNFQDWILCLFKNSTVLSSGTRFSFPLVQLLHVNLRRSVLFYFPRHCISLNFISFDCCRCSRV